MPGLIVYTDGTQYYTMRGMGITGPQGPAGTGGGVNAQTADYTAISGDSGKLISMNGSALTTV